MPKWVPGVGAPLATAGGLEVLVAHLAFVHLEVFGIHGFAGYPTALGWSLDSVLWTLSVEACFYVILPFVARPFFRRPVACTVAAAAIAGAWRVAAVNVAGIGALVGHEPSRTTVSWLETSVASQFPAFLLEFALGMAAALVYVRGWQVVPSRRHRCWTVGVAVLAACLLVLTAHWAVASQSHFYLVYLRDQLPAAVFAGLLLALVLGPRALQWVAANRVARWLGRVSYGVFLWHLVVAKFALRYVPLPSHAVPALLVLIVIVLPCSLLLGAVSWYAVERPAIEWAKRRTSRRRERIELAPAEARA
jgi:peptidoglycan/LPS O-acetylase OafA/YrhL